MPSKSVLRAKENMSRPPIARRIDYKVESPNGIRIDPYYWLRDDTRTSEEVLAYLKQENRYAESVLGPLAKLEEQLYDEIVGRIQADDSTLPYRLRGYHYYTRFEAGNQYPIHARKMGTLDAPEQILLDLNALAQSHEFFSIGARAVSPNNRLLSFAEDTTGRRQYTIKFKEIESGKVLSEQIPGTNGQMLWAADNRTLFYVENDATTLLGVRVKKHVLGTSVANDPVVYEERDHSFYIGLSHSADRKFLLLVLSSTISDEVRALPADKPNDKFQVLVAREPDFEYSATHLAGRWVIRTNWRAKNFRLMTASDADIAQRARWTDLVPEREDVLVDGVEVFNSHYVVSERTDGLKRLRVRAWDGAHDYVVASDDAAYVMYFDVNPDPASTTLRYSYNSLTTPRSVFELDLSTGKRRLLKRQPVPTYEPERYQAERLWAKARDGARIPVSLLYKKGVARDGSAPVYQYGYGAYGHSSDPVFRSTLVSLLDRGFVFVIAHVRGGQELGRPWYEQGRKLNKRNSFTDFIDVTEFLVRERIADPARIVASGGSAGGLLVGAVANMRPELYRLIVAHVPFVDVVTTMLDESIPLTTNEFDEWGNPKQREFYEYMLSYSPYDNVKSQSYPAMFVTTGLWDSQVQYFEPAKWVAKLRATKTDENLVVFNTNMDSGHGGKSGRYRAQRERAKEYAFVLGQLAAPE